MKNTLMLSEDARACFGLKEFYNQAITNKNDP